MCIVFTVFLYCFVYVYFILFMLLFNFVSYELLSSYLCILIVMFYEFFLLCILTVMYALFCTFCFHRASWHSSATLTEVYQCFFLSFKANARV